MWTSEKDTLRADKVALFLYFREYAEKAASVTDDFLLAICETAREVTNSESQGN